MKDRGRVPSILVFLEEFGDVCCVCMCREEGEKDTSMLLSIDRQNSMNLEGKGP